MATCVGLGVGEGDWVTGADTEAEAGTGTGTGTGTEMGRGPGAGLKVTVRLLSCENCHGFMQIVVPPDQGVDLGVLFIVMLRSSPGAVQVKSIHSLPYTFGLCSGPQYWLLPIKLHSCPCSTPVRILYSIGL